MIFFFKHLYLKSRFYWLISNIVLFFVMSHFYDAFYLLAEICFIVFIGIILMDAFLLFHYADGLSASRVTPARLSNGDANPIEILLNNHYPFPVTALIIDELPFQFQIRDFNHHILLTAGQQEVLKYNLRPTKRGDYHFGVLNIYIATLLGLFYRKYCIPQQKIIPVYPSVIQMRKYSLLATSNRLAEAGIKKIRQIGHTMEFEQIRGYVQGDDYRNINWKATARRHEFMVNHYQDEKSQQVYNVINMGRVMKMPFEGMSLLDYAINASLVLSNIAIQRQDRAGIITFSNQINAILPADRKPEQMAKILKLLYRQQTEYLEPNYELLYINLVKKVNRRSLILLYTNFETLTALKRQLRFLRNIARKHLLVVIFFENTELKQFTEENAMTIESVYFKTIAEQFIFEKKQIVKELRQYGIHALLTPPQHLSVNTLNEYLQLKARRLI